MAAPGPVMQAEISLAEPSLSGGTKSLLRRSSLKVRRDCTDQMMPFVFVFTSFFFYFHASCSNQMRESRDRAGM